MAETNYENIIMQDTTHQSNIYY